MPKEQYDIAVKQLEVGGFPLSLNTAYSRTSMARTPMAHLPGLIRTHF